jgi:hypothetical protein
MEWQDPLLSSIDKFLQYGWTGTVDYKNETLLKSLQTTKKTVSQLPGVFDIPVCPRAVSSLADFKKIIDDKGISYGPSDNGLPSGGPREMVYPG